jgi:hypothetical protein
MADLTNGFPDNGAFELNSASLLALSSTVLVASEGGFPLPHTMPNQQRLAEVPLALEELTYSCAPSSEEKTAHEVTQVDVEDPQMKDNISPVKESPKELVCTSGSPVEMLVEEAVPSLIERRSFRLDKKNKDCDIPTARCAEYRQADAFGEVPKIRSKEKATEEVLNKKMQHFLQMYKKEHTTQVVVAVRALVEVNA